MQQELILPKRVLRVLGYNYFLFFDERSPLFVNNVTAINEANLIIKNLKITLNKNSISYKNKNFIYLNPFLTSRKETPKIKITIEPFENIPEDVILSLENILNRSDYICTSYLMTPLFDCMGWILNNKTGKWKISFIGSPLYDAWKEQMLIEKIDKWKDDDEIFDWWNIKKELT